MGKRISTDFSNENTSDTNTSPNRIRYVGDPVSIFEFTAKTVTPPFGFRFDNSAHSYKGLLIKDAVPLHDTPKNRLEPSPDDNEATAVTE